jgi:hypothetical protein
MSRCRQTDALLDAVFAAMDLTRSQAAHAASCSECAHALSQARRFDATLERIGVDLSPELAPAAAELSVVETPDTTGGRLMTVRRGLVGGVVAAALVGAALVGARWLSGDGGASGVGSEPPAAALAGEFDGWLKDAEEVAEITQGGAPRLVRAEDCDPIFTAVLQDDVSREFSWVSGPKDDASEATGGTSRSMYVVEMARDRAVDDALCERIVDATISRADAAAAVERMGGMPADAEVQAASLLAPDMAMVVVEGSVNFWSENQWWVGLLHRSDGDWWGTVEEWIGTNVPDETGGLRLIPRNMIAAGVPETDVLVTVLPVGAVAIEIDLDGVPHRYDADPGQEMLIVGLPGGSERPIPVRFIGPDGEVFGEHVVEP